MIIIKNKSEIQKMREGGKILHKINKQIKKMIKSGVDLLEIEEKARNLMKKYNVKSSFYKYRGYPSHICISINDEIVHGIPKKRKIKNGDIVSIDSGIKYKGFNSDSAFTVYVGKANIKHVKLIKTVEKALSDAIKKVKPGTKISDISYIIQKTIEKNGFDPVRECSGHGIGRNLHEDPTVPNFGSPGKGPTLQSGMTIAIEPMAVESKAIIKIDSDNWTIKSFDGGFAAHSEHTVLVTDKGHEILT